jgi:transcription elongation factor GreA
MDEQTYLTTEGASRIKEELSRLTGPERVKMAQRLRAAIQQGDLSENADYHKAKEDQAFLEGRIQELEYLIENAIVVDENHGENDVVKIGTKVTLQESGYNAETYLIVGAKEADPRNYRISYESPFGKAIMNKKAGQSVDVETPNGRIKVKILSIE